MLIRWNQKDVLNRVFLCKIRTLFVFWETWSHTVGRPARLASPPARPPARPRARARLLPPSLPPSLTRFKSGALSGVLRVLDLRTDWLRYSLGKKREKKLARILRLLDCLLDSCCNDFTVVVLWRRVVRWLGFLNGPTLVSLLGPLFLFFFAVFLLCVCVSVYGFGFCGRCLQLLILLLSVVGFVFFHSQKHHHFLVVSRRHRRRRRRSGRCRGNWRGEGGVAEKVGDDERQRRKLVT